MFLVKMNINFEFEIEYYVTSRAADETVRAFIQVYNNF